MALLLARERPRPGPENEMENDVETLILYSSVLHNIGQKRLVLCR